MTSFQFCLNASTIRPTPILEQIAVAAKAGYQAIELWHDAVDFYLDSGGKITDIRHALADHGLTVPTTIHLGGWFDAPVEQYPAVLDECKRRMHQAAELGASHIIAGPAPGPADYRRGAQRYRELLDMGAAVQVYPAMEFLGFVDQLNTIEDALEIMELADHPHVATVLDPFHIFRGGGSIESIAKLTDKQIAISHFNDAPRVPPREQQHDRDRVMPGEGHLDLPRYLELLAATGYRRCLSLELFREDLWERDPLDVARIGLDKMKAVVDACSCLPADRPVGEQHAAGGDLEQPPV